MTDCNYRGTVVVCRLNFYEKRTATTTYTAVFDTKKKAEHFVKRRLYATMRESNKKPLRPFGGQLRGWHVMGLSEGVEETDDEVTPIKKRK